MPALTPTPTGRDARSDLAVSCAIAVVRRVTGAERLESTLAQTRRGAHTPAAPLIRAVGEFAGLAPQTKLWSPRVRLDVDLMHELLTGLLAMQVLACATRL